MKLQTQRWFSFLAIFLLASILVACTGSNSNNNLNPNAKYYVGSDGVNTRFQNFPPKLYYYGPGNNAGNEFSFAVDVHNEGASYTRGGVYVSGFDPNMLIFDEIPITGGGLGACGISFGNIGFGELGGIFRCDGVEVSTNGDVTNIRIKSIAETIRALGARFNKRWWNSEKFDLSVDYTNGARGNNFIININNIQGNVEYYQNGRLFIAFLSGIDFRKNNGREFFLAADNYEYPGGESDYLIYNGRIVGWPPGLDQTTQNFLLTSCYQYTTYADPIVCIDPEPFSDIRKVCAPKSRIWNGGNGAPVAITSIEQENTPQKIIFRITVENIGRGDVWDPGTLEKCSPYYPGRVTPEDKNIVYLGDVRVGSYGLEGRPGRGGITCFPEVIRLDPNTERGSTTCTYPIEFINLKSAYQTPLTVELWYGYSETEQRSVNIKRII